MIFPLTLCKIDQIGWESRRATKAHLKVHVPVNGHPSLSLWAFKYSTNKHHNLSIELSLSNSNIAPSLSRWHYEDYTQQNINTPHDSIIQSNKAHHSHYITKGKHHGFNYINIIHNHNQDHIMGERDNHILPLFDFNLHPGSWICSEILYILGGPHLII